MSEGGVSEQKSKSSSTNKKRFKGIRRRKRVSEIRVPGTSSRLWLGSYSTAEATAAAHDVPSFYLRSSSSNCFGAEFNIPEMVRKGGVGDGVSLSLSPRSVHKAASDAGMAVDAAHRVFIHGGEYHCGNGDNNWCFGRGSSMMGSGNGVNCDGEDLNISVDDDYL